jgi:hypothetical protein
MFEIKFLLCTQNSIGYGYDVVVGYFEKCNEIREPIKARNLATV